MGLSMLWQIWNMVAWERECSNIYFSQLFFMLELIIESEVKSFFCVMHECWLAAS